MILLLREPYDLSLSPSSGLTPPSPHHPLEFPLQLLPTLGPLAPSYCLESSPDPSGCVWPAGPIPPSTALKSISSVEPGLDVLSLSKNHC